jgi:anti-anti-sigma regulatory factor
VLDLSEVGFVGAAGLRAIDNLACAVRGAGREFGLAGHGHRAVQEPLRIAGLLSLAGP